jgi:hypothetical protein
MTDYYEPELGQMVFGQPWRKYECPEYIIALLKEIGEVLYRMMGNLGNHPYDNPFSNTGANFKCDVFEVEAYSWAEEPQECNFKYKDIEISWYKYLGRGTTINRETTYEEIIEMFDACIKELRRIEKKYYESIGDQDA